VGGDTPADTEARLLALEREESVSGLLAATARLLVEVLDTTACAISRALGDLLVVLAEYTESQSVQTGHGYLISDYPATREVLEVRRSMTIAVDDPEADEQEVALLRELGFDSLLMLPLEAGGDVWGLVEVYDKGREGFAAEDVAAAEQVVARASPLLARLTGGA
jgi:GAF domain-containing protein